MDKKIKILAICGSPKKGNTYEMIRFLEQSHPRVDFNISMLSECDLEDCLGCYTCIQLGEENCPLEDDRDMIIREMFAADATIFASPTYARAISALMKKFIERTSYIAHRPKLFGKHAMALVTCGGFGADLVSKYLMENFTQYGFRFVPPVELMIATRTENEKKFNRTQALRGYKDLIIAIEAKKPLEPSIDQLVYFNIFKSISELNKNKGPADYEFYKDKRDFYFETDISKAKQRIAKWIARKEVKKIMSNR